MSSVDNEEGEKISMEQLFKLWQQQQQRQQHPRQRQHRQIRRSTDAQKNVERALKKIGVWVKSVAPFDGDWPTFSGTKSRRTRFRRNVGDEKRARSDSKPCPRFVPIGKKSLNRKISLIFSISRENFKLTKKFRRNDRKAQHLVLGSKLFV